MFEIPTLFLDSGADYSRHQSVKDQIVERERVSEFGEWGQSLT